MKFIEKSFLDEKGVECELCGARRQSEFDDGFAIIPLPEPIHRLTQRRRERLQ